MMKKLSAFLSVFVIIGLAFNLNKSFCEGISSSQARGKRCLVKRRPPHHRKVSRPLADSGDCTLSRTVIKNEYWPMQTYIIPIVFHIIHKTDGTRNIPDQRIHRQVQVLNQDFAATMGSLGEKGYNTKIQFELVQITRTANDQWHNDQNEVQYKHALGWDQQRYLNVYVNTASGYLGYSYLPQEDSGDVYDGVVMNYEAVGGRDSGNAPFDQGRTLVHEIGHYLGLLHTFEGYGCYEGYEAGDLIADTHSENAEHYGCTQTYTCGTPDDIHNYMNYTDDSCMYEFTAEQANRLVCCLVNYRPLLFSIYPNGAAIIGLNRTVLNFTAVLSGTTTGPQDLWVSTSGTLDWSVGIEVSWLSCSPTSGANDGVISVSVNPTGLGPGTYTGTITITSANAVNSPPKVTVNLMVKDASRDRPPFGDFATPVHGSTVSSSIPVSGWVLDDVEVTSVKIYSGSTYIGKSVLVEGARPDVENAYPGYPKNHMAGWGYMMLTNLLTNGGNGVYTLTVKAKDSAGNQVILGSKTIFINNAEAVKPFGTIDTPGQGGIVSGSNFVNWGWVLTPQPNVIPTDGSTINVWVDGIKLGHPIYNIYRADIASRFPGYANSNGAVGYFYLDTTAYTNGVHTIQWTATDNAGNTDGIGSRYFTIRNNGESSRMAVLSEKISQIPPDISTPVGIKKGYETDSICRDVYPDTSGTINIKIKELERIEIHLTPNTQQVTLKNTPSHLYSGCLVMDNASQPLPIGSTFDPARGVFSWSPGPGFVGDYWLVFIDKGRNRLKKINIRILPGYTKN
ncbi:MAG: hypothetical protein GTO20_25090 [Candidatus Aminicenantes bacterium]|nr:hypothetical protein [Candidatus Aminicenantes bacterium]NIN21472.1 hypothetical protein [Candidatus Aminicenantes bacterium]